MNKNLVQQQMNFRVDNYSHCRKQGVDFSTLIWYLLSLPGCFWMSSSRCFLAKSMKAFIGRLGLLGSSTFFTGDTGGDNKPSEGAFILADDNTACCSSGVNENLQSTNTQVS